MSSSPVLKLSLALLLPLTLAWKLAVRPADPAELAEKERAAQRKIAEFLIRQHFVVSVAGTVEEAQPTIQATAGACRLLVLKSGTTGSSRDLISRQAGPDDRVFVVFRGKVYADQPTFLTVSDNLWARFRRELGFGGEAAPVLAVIASTICDAERLPWNELRS